MTEKDNSCVQVAVRIRPLIENEISKGCQDILEVFPEIRQIRLKNSDKAFTYNYVFEDKTPQDKVYDTCVKHMIDNLFKGYNMTILAYGQTGSGKTHSMGTVHSNEQNMGIIPRAVTDIFNYVNDNFAYDFTITVSFMELYQEVLYDLLATKPRDQCVVELREDGKNIIIPGLTEQLVNSANKTLEYLMKGSLSRATSSTYMNSQSSRSHAIFTLNICMQKKGDSNENKTAKFHLVDLAGSERSKKTGATGSTFREGVSINKGLFVLGNVISALADDKQQGYICYRDSNLTRLLKDSLGGNSITLMIACVSPADYNLEETLSTLRYADRARRIKNKPIINQDPKAAEINRLNKLIQQLRLELVGQGGPIICQAELDQLQKENVILKKRVAELTIQLSTTLNENTAIFERLLLLQSANEHMSIKLLELKDQYNTTINNLNLSLNQNDSVGIKEHISKLQGMQEMLGDIDKERQKTEDEIRKHERCASTSNSIHSDLASESEFTEKQESHTKQQIAMNTELQQITKMLAMKEHLAQQIIANTCHIADYTSITVNEERIVALETEKEELLQQLKLAQNQGSNSKTAEHKKRRVQDLEKEILELRKKIGEQARLIKLKEKDEEKIKQLNVEIQQMKTNKVKLIKNMKQESETFRAWKLQRERELLKLKEQDRKRQNQIVKMETMHNKQQNVLKRKVEETAAINKRLKDALALRKTVQDQKNTGKVEKAGAWAQQEFDIFVSVIDAEATIALLIEDRAVLTQYLEELKKNLELSDPEQIKQIENEIELHSTQIADLQQKILDSDHETRGKTRWDNIQTMAEAKYVCKTLFELTANIKKKQIRNEAKITELQSSHTEYMQKIVQLENKIQCITTEHEHALSEIANRNEDKISVLLRQLRGVTIDGIEPEFQQRYDIQQQALERAEQEVLTLKEENAQLKLKMDEINSLIQHLHLQTPDVTFKKQQVQKMKKKEYDAQKLVVVSSAHLFEDSDAEGVDSDNPNDPDWRLTPLAKRVQKERDTSIVPPQKPDRLGIKRNSDGSCACRGNCSKRSCGCKKLSKSCTTLCKCSKEICLNKSIDKENDDSHIASSDSEESFKKPSLLQGAVNAKRNRRAMKLF